MLCYLRATDTRDHDGCILQNCPRNEQLTMLSTFSKKLSRDDQLESAWSSKKTSSKREKKVLAIVACGSCFVRHIKYRCYSIICYCLHITVAVNCEWYVKVNNMEEINLRKIIIMYLHMEILMYCTSLFLPRSN